MRRADWILRRSPLQALSTIVNRERVAVLAYHGVEDPERFAAQMDYVARHFRPISIDDLDGAVNGGKALPDRSVLVTFDDGHCSVFESGMPVLLERGIPGALFVLGGLVSTKDDFWWSSALRYFEAGGRLGDHTIDSGDHLVRFLKTLDNGHRVSALIELSESAGRPPNARTQLGIDQLLELESAGIAIGNHTWSHPCLNRCEEPTIKEEIVAAHNRLENLLGRPPRWFAYPNGDWDPYAESLLRDLGYRLAFMFDHRLSTHEADPLRISRLRVNSDTDEDRFATILSGLHPAIHHARGRR